MQKHVFNCTALFLLMFSHLHSATTSTSSNVIVDVNMNHVFSQKIEFSNLRKGSINLSFPKIDTAFLAVYGASSPVFVIPVNEMGRMVDISITANLNSTAGSWQIDNPSTSSAIASITQSIKGWFTSLMPISFGGSSASPNLDDPYSNLSVNVPGANSASGNFQSLSGAQLGGSISSSNYSLFTGAGDFAVAVNADSALQIIADGMDVSVASPSLFGDITLTYTVIPEPSSLSLLALGIGGLIALRRARRS